MATDVSIVTSVEQAAIGWRWSLRVNIDDDVAGFTTVVTHGWRPTQRGAERAINARRNR